MQSLGRGFFDYKGPNADYYGSRDVTTAKSGILGGVVAHRSRPFVYKLKHRRIALP